MAGAIRRSLTIGAGVLMAILVLGLIQARSPNQPQAMVFHNGLIRTMNGHETVEALYMRNGQIMAVGPFEAVRAQAPRVPLFDLEGGALTPGLIEPHTHPLANALLGTAINLSGPYSQGRDEVMARISTGLAQGGPSPWAIGFGWDPI